MSNNYSNKIKNQQEQTKLAYEDLVDFSGGSFSTNIKNDDLLSVEEEMMGGIYKMRHDFKKSAKRLLKLYSNKEPKLSMYKAARPVKFNLIKGGITS